jgi:hypothetical protein
VAELAELDARAIPMLVDLCFFDAEAPEKAKRSAYKAMERIRDDVAVSYLACHLRDWELGKNVSQLMATVIHDDSGFEALTVGDQVRLLVGLRRGALLRERLHDVETVLLNDLVSGTTTAAESALWTLIALGEVTSVPKLVATLRDSGAKIVAETYLNCSQPQLVESAEEWARSHGFQIYKTAGSPKITWRSM